MNYFSFFKQHPKKLSFGLLHAFFAGLGQTFLLALFAPGIIEKFELNYTEFGVFYSLATIINALLLSWVGSKIDFIPLKKYTRYTFILFLTSSIIAAVSPSLWVLFPAMVGLRLSGQSLMTHIAATTMAKNFSDNRGKALGISTLGHPGGEAILAPIIAIIISSYSYQIAFAFIALILIFIYWPLNLYLLKSFEEKHQSKELEVSKNSNSLKSTEKKAINPKVRRRILYSREYIFLVPASISAPFILTGLFLSHTPLAILKNWDKLWLAQCFTAFAIARIIGSIFIGPLIDKFKASRLFAFHLLPLALGLLSLYLFDNRWVALFYLSMGGLSIGLGSNLKSALVAEIFGSEKMGTARSLIATAVAISTGISPVTFGWIVDHNLIIEAIIIGFFGILMISSLTHVALTKIR